MLEPAQGKEKGKEKGKETESEGADATAAHPLGPPAPAPSEPATGNDADLWRYQIGAQPWARTLKRAGCKIGPSNWRTWHRLIERVFPGSAEACATAAAKVQPIERWPDKVEAAAGGSPPPSPTASKYAGRPTRTAQV